MFDNEIALLKRDILSRFGEDKSLYVDFEGEKCVINEVDYRGWFHLNNGSITGVVNLKPYLRPISSMTDDERNEIKKFGIIIVNKDELFSWSTEARSGEFWTKAFDWLDSHFFDWRGLIPMGLALEATEDMYI